ncbi:MAG: hypothetical protein IIC91_06070 [Chloroflexi bacterium]|nr:hypothetical protein [Chloroflexota bacterium]
MTDNNFDASKYLTKLSGKDYLEVKWRLLWLRTLHPDAVIETELVKHGAGLALFRARVTVPGAGSATGWGSETAEDFGDFIEKAETKALGRALAALGYGTQFCEDFDFTAETKEPRKQRSTASRQTSTPQRTKERVVDSPVARNGLKMLKDGGAIATPAQVKAIYTITRDAGGDEDTVEGRCRAVFSCLPAELTKQQASEFIDLLREPTSQATDNSRQAVAQSA